MSKSGIISLSLIVTCSPNSDSFSPPIIIHIGYVYICYKNGLVDLTNPQSFFLLIVHNEIL